MKSDKNKNIYDFFMELDRSFFLEDEYKDMAHFNGPLPIGFDQTISQPSLVLEMTLELDLDKDLKVLEFGTGSGYQTVLLAEFSKEVYTVERIKELSQKAQMRLNKLGYTNVKFRVGDGSKGWKEFAPYDRIIVTAGAQEIPKELIQQLKVGGKMVIPVGRKNYQDLLLIKKVSSTNIEKDNLGKVRFVELRGKYGWNKAPL